MTLTLGVIQKPKKKKKSENTLPCFYIPSQVLEDDVKQLAWAHTQVFP